MNSISNLSCIVLAGGLGKRLQSEVPNLQKVLAPVNRKPFLHYVLYNLSKNNINNVILAVGHRNQDVLKTIDNIRPHNMNIRFSIEKQPLGTGGAIRNALPLIKTNEVLICNGDSLSMFPLEKLYSFHQIKMAKISILLARIDNISRYGSVEIDRENRIVEFIEKKASKKEGLINSGIYILKKELIHEFLSGKSSIELDYFPKRCCDGMYGFIAKFPFIDIGIPEDYYKAEKFIKELI